MNLQDLIEEIRNKPSSLFYGSGITQHCGGVRWADLFGALKTKFPEDEDSDDFFKYMQNVIGFNDLNRKEVEDYIRTVLAPISMSDEIKYLFSIPWKAVFTTNYDQIPEMMENTLDDSRSIIPIIKRDQDFSHLSKDLYCFKLMGDSETNHPFDGSMILTSGDIWRVGEYRT